MPNEANPYLKAYLDFLYGASGGFTYKTLPRCKCTFTMDAGKVFTLTKCMDCTHCFKLEDGEYRCKYSIHSGKPERETCNYERKKR